MGISNAIFHQPALYAPPGAESITRKFPQARRFPAKYFSQKPLIFATSALQRERWSNHPASPGRNQSAVQYQAASNKSTRRAGARGGGCAHNPKCVRMRSITEGCSITAMIFNLPPHAQRSISMSNTRFNKRAQQQAAQRYRERQHPLAHGHARDDLINQVRGSQQLGM